MAVQIAFLATTAPAVAQAFKPSKPIELVVHTGPGGGNDVLARAIAAMVEKEKLLPVRMQVVNKTGGVVVVGPPDMPAGALAFWEDFFARMVQTASWKRYLEDYLFEDGFQKGPELAKFMGEFPQQIRGILRDAGVKVVR